MIHDPLERRGPESLLHCAVFFLLLLLFSASLAPAQPSQPRRDPPPADTARPPGGDSLRRGDTLAADSLAAGDTSAVRRPDTVVIRNPGAPLGALVPVEEGIGYDLLQKRDLVWERYFTAFDLFAERLPAYPLSQGGPGMVRAFTYAGSSPGSISALYNGRPLWGPFGSPFDLELYPMEYIERAEILRGARAAILGSGESLIALNFTQPHYNVEGSYARLWYVQGANSTTDADITFARNIGDRGNLSLGLRRLSGNGVFPNNNQNVSGWSGRGSVRWDPSDNLTVSLTEIFSDATRGLSGGLLPESSRQPLFAEVYNDSLRERTLRHDVTVAARWYPRSADVRGSDTGTATMRLADTTLRIDGDVYFTYAERELQASEHRAAVASPFSRAGIAGARAGLTIPVDRFRLLANGVLEYGDNDRVRFEGGGLLELPLGSVVTVRGGGKISGYAGDVFVTVVGEGALSLSENLALRGSVRSTTLLDPRTDCPSPDPGGAFWYPLDGHYTGSMVEGGVEWRSGGASLELEGFVRGAVPAECIDLASYTVSGGAATVRIPYWFLMLESHLVATVAPEEYRGVPLLHGTSDLSARLNLFDGNLNLRLGTVLEYQTGLPSIQYRDIEGDFAVSAGSRLGERPPFPLWTAYAQARIGTAYIRVEMYNILDNKFFTTYRYPMFGRAVNIAVNWAFID